MKATHCLIGPLALASILATLVGCSGEKAEGSPDGVSGDATGSDVTASDGTGSGSDDGSGGPGDDGSGGPGDDGSGGPGDDGSGGPASGPDADGDGIADSVEGSGDPDEDGVPNFQDTDSDNDGVPDSVEGIGDLDEDGVPNFQDPDSDGDGIPDSTQGLIDANDNGIPDYLESSGGSGTGGSGTQDGSGTGGNTADGSGGNGGSTGDGTGGGSTGDGTGGGSTGDGTGGGSTGDGTGGGNTGDGTGGGNTGDGTGGNTGDGTGGSGGITGDPPIGCIESPIDEVNVIVFNNASPTGADTEGRMYVGGNADFAGGYSVGSQLGLDCSRYDLVVGGDLTFGSGDVRNGMVAYGGELNLGGGTTLGCGIERNANVVNFDQLEQTMLRYSDALAALPTDGTVNSSGSTLTLTGTNPDVNVFNVSATQFGSNLKIVAPEGSTVLVNVSGSSVTLRSMGFELPGGMCRGANGDWCHRILYNFPEAETLTLEGIGVQGSVLAPRADLLFNNGNVDGQVIVENLTGSGEFHPYYFTGCIELPWW